MVIPPLPNSRNFGPRKAILSPQVRVVSEQLGKRLYLMKGNVVDVVMDDGLELVQGVEQDILETVLPRTNGRVHVLYGKHKGVCGRLVEKNSEEIGLVEDGDTKAMMATAILALVQYPTSC
ncbi:hypothetical protein BAE44_0022445 [Dichanthelium oligosanthes]|uniref:KOW domain-containing protein n=1 Tax=Dichanthelium oligosanthes TaxID=888268 RepID=A0A1E5UUQ8_9POAL|nr:hypothetical protein BAE44_0022445 [Dichanthelium oligosanthes]